VDWTGEPIARPDCVWISDRSLVDLYFVGRNCVTLEDLTLFCAGEELLQGPFNKPLWRAKHLWRRWFPE
jgi:hypothetical protein